MLSPGVWLRDPGLPVRRSEADASIRRMTGHGYEQAAPRAIDGAVMSALDELRVPVRINTTPNELPSPIPFEQDDQHAAYDADAAQRYWRALVQVDRVFKAFRSGFLGKCSPVHFFWGSFDVAV